MDEFDDREQIGRGGEAAGDPPGQPAGSRLARSREAAHRIRRHWSEFARENWKELALVGAVTAVVTTVATLAATHNTAVAENARAYTNGLRDGMDKNIRTYLSGYGDCLDDYDVDDDW